MDLNRLKSFYYVVNDGTFTAASGRLNITQSSVSRQVIALEKELKVKLFTREKRKVRLTEAGGIYFSAVEAMIRESNKASNAIFDLQKNPRGLVSIASTDGLCERFFIKHIHEFKLAYPHLRLRLVNSDSAAKFPHIGCEAAILPASSSPVDYIRKYLTTYHFALFASEDYLQENGVPKCPSELEHHRLIACGIGNHLFPEMDWGLVAGLKPRSKPRIPHIQVNLNESIAKLAQDGLGIVTLERALGSELGLIQLFPDIELPEVDIFFVYPTYLKQCRKIHVVGQFLRDVSIREFGK